MITRQFGSEVRWMLRRPRTLIGLFGLILVPIIISFGIWTAGEGDGGPGLAAILQGNGMVVPIFTLFLSLNLLLRRNQDQTLPASHTVELAFTTPPGDPSRAVRNVGLLQFKNEETTE